ncbi:MAG: hypothetical protein AAF826_06210 [Pseudomonadota bacterium]
MKTSKIDFVAMQTEARLLRARAVASGLAKVKTALRDAVSLAFFKRDIGSGSVN